MKKNLYKSAIDKVPFDERLDEKITEYISENGVQKKSITKIPWKMNGKISVAAAACAVCMISVTTYAAVTYFKDTAHIDYGLTTKSEDKDSINYNDTGILEDTSDIRSKLANDLAYELVSEEKGNSEVKWNKKSVFKDKSASYHSDDTIKWEVDKEDSKSIITEYAYQNYELATKDAGLPNIMDKLIGKVTMSSNALVKECSIEDNPNINSKQILGDFDYKKGRISLDLSQDLTNKDGSSGNYSVITGINKATNQRSYESKDGITYKLSDNVNDGIKKTTTLITKGAYNLIIEFYALSENEIQEVLDNIDLSEF